MSAVAVDEEPLGEDDRLRPGTTGALRGEGDWSRGPGLPRPLPPLAGLFGEDRRMEHFLLVLLLLLFFFLTPSESTFVTGFERIFGG